MYVQSASNLTSLSSFLTLVDLRLYTLRDTRRKATPIEERKELYFFISHPISYFGLRRPLVSSPSMQVIAGHPGDLVLKVGHSYQLDWARCLNCVNVGFVRVMLGNVSTKNMTSSTLMTMMGLGLCGWCFLV